MPDSAPEVEPGRYRHYKGRYYEVLHLARHSESEEWLVIYRALYGERGVWARPAAMFLESVHYAGTMVRRFEPCADGVERAAGTDSQQTE